MELVKSKENTSQEFQRRVEHFIETRLHALIEGIARDFGCVFCGALMKDEARACGV
jgi:hypothetical protein